MVQVVEHLVNLSDVVCLGRARFSEQQMLQQQGNHHGADDQSRVPLRHVIDGVHQEQVVVGAMKGVPENVLISDVENVVRVRCLLNRWGH